MSEMQRKEKVAQAGLAMLCSPPRARVPFPNPHLLVPEAGPAPQDAGDLGALGV